MSKSVNAACVRLLLAHRKLHPCISFPHIRQVPSGNQEGRMISRNHRRTGLPPPPFPLPSRIPQDGQRARLSLRGSQDWPKGLTCRPPVTFRMSRRCPGDFPDIGRVPCQITSNSQRMTTMRMMVPISPLWGRSANPARRGDGEVRALFPIPGTLNHVFQIGAGMVRKVIPAPVSGFPYLHRSLTRLHAPLSYCFQES